MWRAPTTVERTSWRAGVKRSSSVCYFPIHPGPHLHLKSGSTHTYLWEISTVYRHIGLVIVRSPALPLHTDWCHGQVAGCGTLLFVLDAAMNHLKAEVIEMPQRGVGFNMDRPLFEVPGERPINERGYGWRRRKLWWLPRQSHPIAA